MVVRGDRSAGASNGNLDGAAVLESVFGVAISVFGVASAASLMTLGEAVVFLNSGSVAGVVAVDARTGFVLTLIFS